MKTPAGGSPIMRMGLVTTLTIALVSGLLARTGHAQRGASSDAPRASRSSMLYSEFQAGSGVVGLPGTRATPKDPRPYTRTGTSPPPRPLYETNTRVSRPRSVGDYYPTMRTGQGPNRNVVDPRRLCNPSRRALIGLAQGR